MSPDRIVTVRDVLAYYLREHVRVKVKDWRRVNVIAGHLCDGMGDVQVADIDARTVNRYCEGRRAGTIGNKQVTSDGTLRRELGALTAAINFAIADRKMARAEAPTIRMPDAPGPRDLWLTEAETDDLLAAAERVKPLSWRGWLFTLIACETASRRRAIETLAWEQVDLAQKLIHFQGAGRVQSKKRRVSVPISDRLHPALAEAFQARTCGFVLGSDSECANGFYRVTSEAYRTTGNEKFLRLHPHALRHTWACQAARAGVDLFQISGVLGNSLSVCQKNYLHHCPDHLRAAVNFRR